MRAASLAGALALALLAPAYGQADADGLLVGSIALAQPQDDIGKVSVHVRPLGDPSHEFSIAFVNAGLISDKPDVQSAGERAWLFTRRLAPGRYEIVRMQSCLATSSGSFFRPVHRGGCGNLDGDQPLLLDVKPGATVYVGRWHLTLKSQQPPEPYLAWKPPRVYLRDAYAEDLSLLAARKPGNAAPAAVENPIAALVGTVAKP